MAGSGWAQEDGNPRENLLSDSVVFRPMEFDMPLRTVDRVPE